MLEFQHKPRMYVDGEVQRKPNMYVASCGVQAESGAVQVQQQQCASGLSIQTTTEKTGPVHPNQYYLSNKHPVSEQSNDPQAAEVLTHLLRHLL
jgi:hypothetical protein